MQKVNIAEKFRVFDKYWQSKVVSEFNGQHVKLAKMKGEFEWHRHKSEDEFYLMLKGQLIIQMRDREVVLGEGDLFVVPSDRDHRIIAREDVHLLMIDPRSTAHSDASAGVPDSEPAEGAAAPASGAAPPMPTP